MERGVEMEQEKTLYEYVYRMILHTIHNGKYRYNEELPSLNTLCKAYGVGRNTMRTALQNLQSHGYVVLEKGSPAKVLFDINDFDNNVQYRQTMLDSYQMIYDVFTVIEWIMPDISVICMRNASKEQIKGLEEKVIALSQRQLVNEIDVYEYLYDLYLYVLSFLDNPILNDLFLTLMNSLTLPLVQNEEEHKKLTNNFDAMKKTFTIALRFVLKGNDFMLRKLIYALCKGIKNITLSYTKRLTQGMTIKEKAKFSWVSNRSQEYLYTRVVTDIMNDIKTGIYHNGDLLPSLAKLATLYEVSERTSRKAVKKLNEFHIVNTINGIGSRIQLDDQTIKDFMKSADDHMLNGLQHYRHSLQLLDLFAGFIFPHVQNQFNKERCQSLADKIGELDVFTFDEYFQLLFTEENDCLRVIYEELNKPMNWNLIACIMADKQEMINEIKALQPLYCEHLRKRHFHKMNEIMHQVFAIRLQMADMAIAACQKAFQ